MKRLLTVAVFILTAKAGFAGAIDKQFEMILDEYYKIQSSLAQDKNVGIDVAAKAIAHHTHGIQATDPEVSDLVSAVQKAAHRIQGKELKEARSEFFNLSKPIMVFLNKYYSGTKKNFRFFCGMAKKGWVQPDQDTRNPYYGKSMLTCGELIK